MKRLFLAMLLAAGACGGCAKAQAKASPIGPPLEIPQPPARVLAPVVEPAPPEVPVVVEVPAPEEPPPVVVAPRPPSRPAARPQPAPPAAAPAQAAEPPRALRAGSAAADVAAERAVRDLINRASRDLGRVDAPRLTTDGRSQYEQARRFVLQAEQALRDRNVVFANTLAEKAAALAAQLPGR